MNFQLEKWCESICHCVVSAFWCFVSFGLCVVPSGDLPRRNFYHRQTTVKKNSRSTAQMAIVYTHFSASLRLPMAHYIAHEQFGFITWRLVTHAYLLNLSLFFILFQILRFTLFFPLVFFFFRVYVFIFHWSKIGHIIRIYSQRINMAFISIIVNN